MKRLTPEREADLLSEIHELWADKDRLENLLVNREAQLSLALEERDLLICEKRGLEAALEAVRESNKTLKSEIDSAKHQSRRFRTMGWKKK